MREILEKLVKEGGLNGREISEFMDKAIAGGTNAQIGAVLAALRTKGETGAEIAGFANELRGRMVRVDAPVGAVDLCGTGGDGSGAFNVSTAAAFVVAAAGIPVAKHGNRSVSSRSGSLDVLDALGVVPADSAGMAEAQLREHRLSFLAAPAFHPAMKALAQVRKELGIRTIFNLVGPLANPAGVKRQVVGVGERRLLKQVAEGLALLGSYRALVFHGYGFDELSPLGRNDLLEIRNGRVVEFTEELPSVSKRLYGIYVKDAKESARIVEGVFAGKRGMARDFVVLNSGAAIYVAGKAETVREGMKLAEKAIDSGEAKGKLESMRREHVS